MKTVSDKFFTIRNMALIAVMTAVMAVSAQIAIPMPSGVSVTLQTFAVALAGYVLGSKSAPVSVAVYILLGIVGAPVFTGFRSGIGIIVGVTGGFLIGFIPMSVLSGIRIRSGNMAIIAFWEGAFGMIGLLICHIVGAAWFSILAHLSYAAALLQVSVPFLLKDAVSVIVAMVMSKAVRKAIRN